MRAISQNSPNFPRNKSRNNCSAAICAVLVKINIAGRISFNSGNKKSVNEGMIAFYSYIYSYGSPFFFFGELWFDDATIS